MDDAEHDLHAGGTLWRVRPVLKPALCRAWRDPETLQLGIDPASSVVLTGLGPAEARLLAAMDGSRDVDQLVRLGEVWGVARERSERLLELLAEAGALDDAAADRGPLRALPQRERERLAGDLATWSLLHRADDGGVSLLARRRTARVEVEGQSRIAELIADLLRSAGVGRVTVLGTCAEEAPRSTNSTAAATTSMSAPSTSSPTPSTSSVPRSTNSTAAATTSISAPSTSSPTPRPSERRGADPLPGPPQIVVLAGAHHPDLERARQLTRAAIAHLVVGVRETVGTVGPLVMPGLTTCSHCVETWRAGRDPAWPRVLAQVTAGRRTEVETVLAAAVAATAAVQVLRFLDGAPGPRSTLPWPPPAVDATLEVSLADGRVRRRSWSPHPWCECGADAARHGGLEDPECVPSGRSGDQAADWTA